jgi:YD repeat-containing protein
MYVHFLSRLPFYAIVPVRLLVGIPQGLSPVPCTYDAADRLTGYTLARQDASGETLAYTLDAVGNRVQETRTETANGASHSAVKTYHYDAYNRLTRIGTDDGDIDYTYDANGNTLSRTDAGVTPAELTRFVYDSRDQLV